VLTLTHHMGEESSKLKTSWTWQYDPVHTISNWCVRCHSKPYLHDPNTMMQMKANKDTWEEVREI